MAEPPRQDHASRLNDLSGKPPPALCGAGHPLLQDMWCQRLRGHPGRHAAVTDAAASDLALEWGEEGARPGESRP
jgi:hypothetical protein